MRKILVATFTSLDGVMQAPGGPQEDPTGGFTFGGWTAPYFDEALGAAMGEIFGRPVRPAARPQDLRHLRGVLALRHRPESPDRQSLQPGDEIRRFALQPEARPGRTASCWVRTLSHR